MHAQQSCVYQRDVMWRGAELKCHNDVYVSQNSLDTPPKTTRIVLGSFVHSIFIRSKLLICQPLWNVLWNVLGNVPWFVLGNVLGTRCREFCRIWRSILVPLVRDLTVRTATLAAHALQGLCMPTFKHDEHFVATGKLVDFFDNTDIFLLFRYVWSGVHVT